jgi:hypothetical protein
MHFLGYCKFQVVVNRGEMMILEIPTSLRAFPNDDFVHALHPLHPRSLRLLLFRSNLTKP